MEVKEIRYKLLPAEVEITKDDVTTQYGRALIFVTNKGLHMYVDSTEGPVEEFQSPLLDFTGDAKVGWEATTDDGEVITFRRSQNCLCGSRLRGFDPFRGVPYTNTLHN